MASRIRAGGAVGRTLALVALTLAASGCTSWQQLEEDLFAPCVVLDRDDLGPAPAPAACPPGEARALDLEVVGFEGDARHFLAAVVAGLDAHPGLAVGGRSYQGQQASFGARRAPEASAPCTLRLSCQPRFGGSWTNALVAFPGMIPFLPMWVGYSFELELALSWEVVAPAPAPPRAWPAGGRRVTVRFREQNARRSALFHLWPTTGTYGLQFLLGLVLAPTLCFYDGETTPHLVEALQPRLGQVVADAIHRDLQRWGLGAPPLPATEAAARGVPGAGGGG